MSWRLKRLGVALGLFALAAGLAYLFEGFLIQGVVLVAISVPLCILPIVTLIRGLTHEGIDGSNMGLRRSSAADDPAIRRRLKVLGVWLVALSVAPFFGAAALLIAALSSAARELGAGATAGAAVLVTFFGMIPVLFGVQLIRAGVVLSRGYRQAAEGAARLLLIATVLAGLAAAMALSDRQHPQSTNSLLVSTPVIVLSLLTITAIYVTTMLTAERNHDAGAPRDHVRGGM